jgi:hypothetical protein
MSITGAEDTVEDALAGASSERTASGTSGGAISGISPEPLAPADKENRETDQINPNRHTVARVVRMNLLLLTRAP